jgi:flagellar basal body-associated protein FliL
MKKNQLMMLLLVLNTVALMAIYFFLAQKEFPYTHYIYIGAGVLLGFGYLLYNRGFSGKGVTPDMLPDTMSIEEKNAFIEKSAARAQKSKWVLTVLFPIIITLAVDMIYLFFFVK